MEKLNLEVSYQYPFNNWSVFNVFNDCYNHLVKKYKKINFNYTDSGRLYDGNPCSYYSPHIMVIKNKDNGKYIIVSYWDRAEELSYTLHGWDDSKRVQLITSSGVRNNLEYTPFSYVCYSKLYDEMHKNAIPLNKKENNELIFRGYLYGQRYSLANTKKIKIIDERISPENLYFDDLTNNKVCLSLNGAGEICNRDIEILSTKSVLLRPILKQKFHNELIPNFHYVGFEFNNDPVVQADIILETYNKIKDDTKFLKFVSENGYKWFLKNGTVSANAKLLTKLINFELLK